jgi:quinol monooxygenase YgiN
MVDSMYSIFVAINVKPEHRDSFIEASTLEAQGAIRGEPGLFQFQMLVDETNLNRFYFYEIFKDEEAANNHWETEVFKTWWNTVEEMFDGEPETICTMRSISPSVNGLEKQKAGLMNW